MKLHIYGSIHEFGRYAKFDSFKEDLPALIGKKETLAVPDTAILLQSVGEKEIALRFFRGIDLFEDIVLKPGEPYQHKHEGNAYGYELNLELME